MRLWGGVLIQKGQCQEERRRRKNKGKVKKKGERRGRRRRRKEEEAHNEEEGTSGMLQQSKGHMKMERRQPTTRDKEGSLES